MKVLNYLLLALCLGLFSCSPTFYTPNTQNVPLISEKGEINLTFSGNGNQVEFQSAIGVTDHFAAMANGGLFVPPDLDNGNGGSGKFLELGGGYFTPITDRFVFETYGMLGFGSFENHLFGSNSATTLGDISANIFRVGIQPNIGYESTHFTAVASTRISNLFYSNIEGDLIFDNINQTTYLKDNNANILLEPAITIKAGFEKFKVQIQYVYSYNASNSDFSQSKSTATIGLNFNIFGNY